MTVARKGFSGIAVPTSLNGAITDVAVTLTATVLTGWPDGTNGKSSAKIDPGLPTEEDILYTAKAGLNLTGISRGQNGTTPVAHGNGAVIVHGWVSGDADTVYQHMADVEADPHPTKLLNNPRHDLTARHPGGTVIPTGNPAASAPGDTMNAGSGTSLALSNHRHAREAAGAALVFGNATNLGDTANGSGTDVPHANHAHGFPALAPYSPTFDTGGAIGDAVIQGMYARVGKRCFIRLSITMGAATTFGAGGSFRFSTPPGVGLPNSGLSHRDTLFARLTDASGPDAFGHGAIIEDPSGGIGILVLPAGGSFQFVTNLVPWTWAAGDIIGISGDFECT